MTTIKNSLILVLVLSFLQVCHAQECNYNYKNGSLVFWEKELQRTPDQEASSRKSIEKLELCVANTSESLELAWLHHRMAQMQFSLDHADQNVIKNAKASFDAMPKEICTEYIKIHMWSQDDDPFPMQNHFLDVLEDEEIRSIRAHCQDNYKEIYVTKLKERKAKQKTEMQKSSIIDAYTNALEIIEINDQLERAKSNIVWEIQNELDASNRAKLDVLYDQYGFPNIDVVGSELARSAFMVIHHSTDCEWNKKWIPRFVKYDELNEYGDILAFFFYRNFNNKDGICTKDKGEVESLFASEYDDKIKDLMDFSHWEKVYEKK